MMDKDILSAVLLNETEPLGIVKPLYCAFSHFQLLLAVRGAIFAPLESFNADRKRKTADRQPLSAQTKKTAPSSLEVRAVDFVIRKRVTAQHTHIVC
jgi:hypothetical protein